MIRYRELKLIVGDRCGDVIVIDPLKVLYMAYESIRFDELLDKLYMLEAEICRKVLSNFSDFCRISAILLRVGQPS